MYISRIELPIRRLSAMKLVASPYRLHAAIERAMPNRAEETGGETQTGRILWRVDVGPREDAIWLYIVSSNRPNLTSIAEQTKDITSCSWATKDYDPALQSLQSGQRWQFRLKANPVRKARTDLGRTAGHNANPNIVGKIQGHVTEVQQRNWLLDRAERNGFAICQDEGGNERMRVSRRRREEFRRGSQRVTLATAQYDGLLEITDVEIFKRTLTCGLGRGKGFGCGLMTIAPA